MMIGFLNAKVIAKIPEASGISISPKTNTLFVANDEGSIYEIDKKGKILRKKFLGKYDLEGVTCGKKFLYFLDEQNMILKLSYEFKIIKKTKIKDIKKDKKHGLEGITKYKNGFLISKQSSKSLFFVDKKGKVIKKFHIGFKDIAGLDVKGDILYIVSDRNDVLIEYDIKKEKIIKQTKLPKFAQEGIAVGKNNFFFADDNGRVLKVRK